MFVFILLLWYVLMHFLFSFFTFFLTLDFLFSVSEIKIVDYFFGEFNLSEYVGKRYIVVNIKRKYIIYI